MPANPDRQTAASWFSAHRRAAQDSLILNIAIHWLQIFALLIFPLSRDFSAQAAVSDPKVPVCHVIATGGTIAMKVDPVKNAPVPALSGEDLIASVPELGKFARVRVESPFNVPSNYIDPERWVTLQKSVVKPLASDDVAGVIVSHGTDTLEETAYFLDLTRGGTLCRPDRWPNGTIVNGRC